jgi:hypothetical protein
MKGTLWLHSTSYLKNSGIFVVKSRQCVVAGSGGISKNGFSNATTTNVLNSSSSSGNSKNSNSSVFGTPGFFFIYLFIYF